MSNADLQNLITSVILRQTSVFSTTELCTKIQSKLTGSSYEHSLDVIEQRCKDTISTLYTINCLKNIGVNQYKLAMSFPSIFKR